MTSRVERKVFPTPFKRVNADDAFWRPRLETNRQTTLPVEYDLLKKTGRIDAFRQSPKPGMPPPHFGWDSDVAKWLEAAAYSVAAHPDAKLERRVGRLVAMIAKAQQKDGYLNPYFTLVEPENRWTNLCSMHELYCAGHLIEAAVAHFEATGTRKFLDVMRRCADHIDSVFGPEKGKKRGYPGHEEIELALVKLHRVTGEGRYLKLAKFFIDERGRRPHYFDIEARARGDARKLAWGYDEYQAHLPVRQQKTAEGHAVRAMYLYSGMADVAAETGDATLLAACKRLWQSVTERRMYITGGVGSSAHRERFAFDYDLPNETAYAETCAAIGLVFWAHRMLQFGPDGKYADVMERALYNGVLSGVSLDGKGFFYTNPLTVYPDTMKYMASGHIKAVRQPWFSCACCPPNIARLLASFGQYVYSESENAAYVHLYVQGAATLDVGGRAVSIEQETEYPWKERVRITVRPERPMAFTLALRIPGWCGGAAMAINAERVNVARLMRKGYAKIKRVWQPGDVVTLTLPMPVERIEAHPRVRMNAGRIALQRGPLVYCLEEVDNGPNLCDISVPRDGKLRAQFRPKLLSGTVVITGKGSRRSGRWGGTLYRPLASERKSVTIKAVPYCTWGNRKPGEMIVWIRQR